ncbi:acetate/propionate family kinase [Holzapfeliella sp. JNUCC 80]
MTKVLAINAGSSSVKWKMFNAQNEEVIAEGAAERIGITGSNYQIKYDGKKYEETIEIKDQEQAVSIILKAMIELGIVESYDEIKGIGHRIVAGGEHFAQSTLINEDVLNKIYDLSEFAPLHNPVEARCIEAFEKVLPDIPQVAVFDTSFHKTMPKENYLYSIPMEYYEKFGARKYGAHGTSHRYVSQRAADMLGQDIKDLRLITVHMGNGISLTAVENGQSIDTSMGFSPLAGVTMSTRSGDIDASLMAYLMEKLEIENPQEMISILNGKSGLLGLSGLSSDMRDLEDNIENPQVKLTVDIFVNRIVKYISQYITEMGGVDGIVFTAGIGENNPWLLDRISNKFAYLGAKVDPEKVEITRQETIFSAEDSKIKLMLVPTNEEIMIIRDLVEIANL